MTTIQKRWVSQKVYDELVAKSVSHAQGRETVSELPNGGIHYLGKRTQRWSATFEVGEWIKDPSNKRKLVYVLIKLTCYANGTLLHLYADVDQQTSDLFKTAKDLVEKRVVDLIKIQGQELTKLMSPDESVFFQ